MTAPTFAILYVADAVASAAFYRDLLGRAPVDASPGFAMFALDSGTMLGLWTRSTVEPAADGGVGGGEIGLPEPDAAAVDARHAGWSARGLPILQAPVDMPFGRTFVAADPDGHRLRVFTASQP